MEALVLVGGFLAFAALGYYAISKLGDFLDNNQVYIDAEYNQQEKQDCLNRVQSAKGYKKTTPPFALYGFNG